MISIVIPIFNQHEMTTECIYSILRNTKDFELVLVDNGSEPPYHPPHTGFFDTTLIRNEENKGFPSAANQGIEAAKGDVVILLNNDVIVTPGWAERLTGWLDEFDIMGPMTNYSAGLQCISISPYEDEKELDERALDLKESYEGACYRVNWIIGFCMVFRRSLFEELGAFDESLWPCSGEEIDFCLRAKEAGYRIGIARDAYVHHFGSQTFNSMMPLSEYNSICTRNDAHLAERWGKNWVNQAVSDIPSDGLRINLGCGYSHIPGYVNIDIREEVKPDLVCDVLQGLPYEDSTVDAVRAYDFLEHIPIGQTSRVMTEIWRVLKPGGVFDSLTPSTDGRGAFQDPTHVSFWNRNSWFYYSKAEYRKLYGIQANFELLEAEDIETDPANYIIHTHVVAKAVK